MPASRARGLHWRRTLTQVCERGGALEVALAPPAGPSARLDHSSAPIREDLVWRVPLLRVGEDALLVEAPRALGCEMRLSPGTDVVAAVVIGQNRWIFRTRVRAAGGHGGHGGPRGHGERRLALELPDHIERCQRRHGRHDARGLHLPEIDVWPLLDPSTVDRAHRVVDELVREFMAGHPIDLAPIEAHTPFLGPRVGAVLMNIGGGGVGIRLDPADAPLLSRHTVLWLRIPLGHAMPVPLFATAKVAHTHLDSAQFTYAGLAFDFSFYPAAQRTVIDQIVLAMEGSQRVHAAKAA